jgi:hypothetical protein
MLSQGDIAEYRSQSAASTPSSPSTFSNDHKHKRSASVGTLGLSGMSLDIPNADIDGDGTEPDAMAAKSSAYLDDLVLPQGCLFIANLNATKTDNQLHESVKNYFERFGTLFSIVSILISL